MNCDGFRSFAGRHLSKLILVVSKRRGQPICLQFATQFTDTRLRKAKLKVASNGYRNSNWPIDGFRIDSFRDLYGWRWRNRCVYRYSIVNDYRRWFDRGSHDQLSDENLLYDRVRRQKVLSEQTARNDRDQHIRSPDGQTRSSAQARALY